MQLMVSGMREISYFIKKKKIKNKLINGIIINKKFPQLDVLVLDSKKNQSMRRRTAGYRTASLIVAHLFLRISLPNEASPPNRAVAISRILCRNRPISTGRGISRVLLEFLPILSSPGSVVSLLFAEGRCLSLIPLRSRSLFFDCVT